MPPRIERAPLARRVENALLLLRVTVLVQLLLENPLRLVCLPVKFTLAFRIELRQNPGACQDFAHLVQPRGRYLDLAVDASSPPARPERCARGCQ